MHIIFRDALLPVNLPFTILLILVVLYWLAVIVGAADVDWLPDMDLDGPDAGWLSALMSWFHAGDVPVMTVISIMLLNLWSLSMVLNHYFNPAGAVLFAVVFLVVNLAVTLCVGLCFARIIRKFTRHSEPEARAALYKVGQVVTSQVSETFGQVEIPTQGAPIKINARTVDGKVFEKGDKVLVFDQDTEKGIYYVDAYHDF